MRTLSRKKAREKPTIGPQEVKNAAALDRSETPGVHQFAHLAASYEGEWWYDLLQEIKNKRARNAADNTAG